MSNLGLYQVFSTVAKKVGGPGRLLSIVAIGGYAVLRTVEGGGKASIKKIRDRGVIPAGEPVGLPEPDHTYTVAIGAECGGGLTLNVGDQVRVVDRDGDALMVEVVGDAGNPYWVSATQLAAISDFPNVPTN